MNYQIREATKEDIAAILPLLPRLANFELPERRVADHLWEGDAALLKQWGEGQEAKTFVLVAIDENQDILGAAIVTMREELLSHEPSAHLEVLVVADGAEGQGIGQTLIQSAEKDALQRGAQSMTLHVFGNNSRARHLYQRMGYTEELIRAIKHLT